MVWTLLQDPLSLSGLDICRVEEKRGRGGDARPHMDTNRAKSQRGAEQAWRDMDNF